MLLKTESSVDDSRSNKAKLQRGNFTCQVLVVLTESPRSNSATVRKTLIVVQFKGSFHNRSLFEARPHPHHQQFDGPLAQTFNAINLVSFVENVLLRVVVLQ